LIFRRQAKRFYFAQVEGVVATQLEPGFNFV
jgi:hypothetical protein